MLTACSAFCLTAFVRVVVGSVLSFLLNKLKPFWFWGHYWSLWTHFQPRRIESKVDILLLFSQTFQKTGPVLQAAGVFWAEMLIVLAIAAGIGYFLRTVFINSAGEHLCLRLRMYAYISILRQPISWFDSQAHSPARLYTRLASDVPFVKTVGRPWNQLPAESLYLILSLFRRWGRDWGRPWVPLSRLQRLQSFPSSTAGSSRSSPWP